MSGKINVQPLSLTVSLIYCEGSPPAAMEGFFVLCIVIAIFHQIVSVALTKLFFLCL